MKNVQGNPNGGGIYESTRGAYYSDFMSVKAGNKYKYQNNSETNKPTFGARYYDKNFNYVAYVSDALNNGYTVPQDGYIRFVMPNYEANKDNLLPYVKLTNMTLKKDVNIEKGSVGNREYTAKWKEIPYNITYNLNGGSLPLIRDKHYIYQDFSNPYGDDWVVEYGTVDFTNAEEISVSIDNQWMSNIYIYIDNDGFKLENTYESSKDSFLKLPDKYKKKCNVRVEYTLADEPITPGITTYKYNAPKTYTVNGLSSLPTPTKSNYNFKGWKMDIKPESWEDGFISLETGEDGLGSTGASYPNAKRTGFIKLNKGVTYKLSIKDISGNVVRVRFYDMNKKYIENYPGQC